MSPAARRALRALGTGAVLVLALWLAAHLR